MELDVGRLDSGAARANTPPAPTPIVSGPLRNNSYSSPRHLRQRLSRSSLGVTLGGAHEDQAQLQVVLQVLTDAWQVLPKATPCDPQHAAGPMPESCMNCGEPIAPAAAGSPRGPRRRG